MQPTNFSTTWNAKRVPFQLMTHSSTKVSVVEAVMDDSYVKDKFIK